MTLTSAALIFGLLGHNAQAVAPAGQAALNTWWKASQKMWIGDDAYEAKGTTYSDGQCTAQFDDGIIIPVYTGVAPLSERVVGVLFIGSGALSVDLPNRADAWSLANQLVLSGERDQEEMISMARGGAPYTTSINRAVILSADPAVEQMLLDKMPVGSGVYRTATEEGINEEYVVTESRGKLRAKMISTNMLPQRTLRLEQAGLDPVAMLRQDRLMHEELGFPSGQLRRLADFRTGDRFHVAAHEGAGVGPSGFDSWMTCFQDPLGHSDVGEKTTVFAHGEDGEGDRHFQRLAGVPFEQPADAMVPRPAIMMEAVSADTKIVMKPVQRRNYMSIEVDSLLTVTARGGALQHVALSLPTEGSPLGEFKLLGIEGVDGTSLAQVGLHADSAFSVTSSVGATADAMEVGIDEGAETLESAGMEVPDLSVNAGLGGGGGGDGPSVDSDPTEASGGAADEDDPLGTDLEMQTVSPGSEDFDLVTETPFRYEILVLLPEPIPEGETAQIRLKWRSKWKNNNRTFNGLNMGATTGMNRFLPELIPAPGGTVWHAKTELSLSPARLYPLDGAITGNTLSEVTGDDGWRTIVAEAPHARAASVGTGKWVTHRDEAAAGLPSVRVALMSVERRALAEFAPEIRRVVSFLQRFLPKLEVDEIEVYQGPAMLPSSARSTEFRWGRSGLVQLRNIKTTDVGANTEVQKKYPALTQSMLARQVAHQYWGQRTPPNSSRDLWVTEALADAYGAFYVRAGLGKETWDKRIERIGRRLEKPVDRGEGDDVRALRRPVSLTEPSHLSDIRGLMKADYGFYLLAHSLRGRIGATAFFLGVDRLAQRRNHVPVTTADLQAIFEETSGEDLADFFDFWVHGGRFPKLELEYALVDSEEGSQTVKGCLVSDVPFGSFDVTIEIGDAKGEVAALVDVDDGRGAFEVPGRTGEVSIQMDPKRWLVLYKRKIKQVGSVDKLSCADAG
jgi:hypothetical protein